MSLLAKLFRPRAGPRRPRAVAALLAVERLAARAVGRRATMRRWPARAIARTRSCIARVRLVAEAAARVPLLALRGRGASATEHPLLRLLARPNPRAGGAALSRDGSMRICCSPATPMSRRSAVDGAVRELYVLRPDRMQGGAGRRRLARGL